MSWKHFYTDSCQWPRDPFFRTSKVILDMTWVQQVGRKQKAVREHEEKWQLMGLSEQHEAPEN